MIEGGHNPPPIIQRDLQDQAEGRRAGRTAVYSCPACGGVLWQMEQGRLVQFLCHVGHTYSPELLLLDKSEELEGALWATVRMLVEKATLTRQIAERLRAEGDSDRADAVAEQAKIDEQSIHQIRDLILGAIPNPTAQAYSIEDILNRTGEDRASLPR